MRVAINGWFWGRLDTGSGQYLHRLVEHLARLEAEVWLVTPGGSVRFQPPGPDPITIPSGNLAKVWFEQAAFPRACRRLGAEVAHVPYWGSPVLPAVPTVVTIHDLIPLLLREYRGGVRVRGYTSLVAASAGNAALVLTDSESSRRDIVEHLGISGERVRAVPLAADISYRPEPGPRDAEVRGRYGLPSRYLLYLGGFDVRKNVAAALESCRWTGPVIGDECPLVVAGRLPRRDTPFTPDPRPLARALGVERWVRFIGPVEEEDKPALYRGAAVFLFPSRYEGFGLAPLEAMACGTPVVGSDVSSIPEVVDGGGVLVPPDDVEGMAGAVIQLVQDRAFRARLSRRALEQASRFSWPRTAQETLAAYRDAL